MKNQLKILMSFFGILAGSLVFSFSNQPKTLADHCGFLDITCFHENTSECQSLSCTQPNFKPQSSGKMILSNKNTSLAINAWDGAQHGTVLRLHNNCVSSNPDCTWTYRNGMLISDKNPSLAINAWDGTQHGTVLRLHNKCVPTNPDCTWTYRNGMFVSDRNPSLVINAWEGAQHGTVLRLHNGCVPSNPDCTWSLR
jgi:hypothetical protein